VSDLFLTRYERVGRSIDPVLAHALEFGQPTYNLGLMPLDRWLNTPVYRKAAYLHCFRQVVIAPIIIGGRAVGTVNVGDADTVSEIDGREIDIIALVTRCLSIGLRELAHRGRLRRGARLTAAAFDQAPIPMALTRADARAPRLNAAAKDLLRNTDEVSAVLQLLARPDDQPSFVRDANVMLRDGSQMRLRGVSKPVGCPANALLTAMQLLDTPPVAAALAVLTPREREVAQLAASDLTDAQIAAKLHISVYTVGQHLKRAYRKLGVHTRVGLTRLTLGSSIGARYTDRHATATDS
jgi:DNA-binding CsgD family transcriptional regulator